MDNGRHIRERVGATFVLNRLKIKTQKLGIIAITLATTEDPHTGTAI